MADVTIVGGGPVGLLLALKLHALGIRSSVLERRSGARDDAGSIGIHPRTLELLDELGLGGRFVERGVRVVRGLAFAGSRPLGAIEFGSCLARHRFVLRIDRSGAESILREALEERAPATLRTGLDVLDVTRSSHAVRVRTRDTGGRERDEESAFVVGCDGRASRCRESSAIPFRGASFPGGYLTGDAPRTGALGDEAALFLHGEGIVESFPLPGSARRWVVRRSEEGPASAEELAETIGDRTGHRVRASELTRLQLVRAERFVAERLAVGRLALAGEAAHVIGPIGSDGANVGWVGAFSLATALAGAVHAGAPTPALSADARHRSRSARLAVRRDELDVWLGEPATRLLREGLVRVLLARPFGRSLAGMLTMRGLHWGA